MAALDQTRPYGVVCGNHHAKFEQDNKLFDALGNEIQPTASAAPEATEQPATDDPQDPQTEQTVPVVRRRGGRKAK